MPSINRIWSLYRHRANIYEYVCMCVCVRLYVSMRANICQWFGWKTGLIYWQGGRVLLGLQWEGRGQISGHTRGSMPLKHTDRSHVLSIRPIVFTWQLLTTIFILFLSSGMNLSTKLLFGGNYIMYVIFSYNNIMLAWARHLYKLFIYSLKGFV